MSDSFGDFMIGEATRKTQEINQLSDKLATANKRIAELESDYRQAIFALGQSEDAYRELTRQVEQLRAMLKALIDARPSGAECEYFHHASKDQHTYEEACKPRLRWEQAVEDAIALTAPPSSSDPGRADTGREER